VGCAAQGRGSHVDDVVVFDEDRGIHLIEDLAGDLGLGERQASLVTAAEALQLKKVFTLDRRLLNLPRPARPLFGRIRDPRWRDVTRNSHPASRVS
jgi:hypothetical protein